MKILIGRHNGIGDIVMAVPFLKTYMEMGHDVTFACERGKHQWLQWVFPGLKTIDCISDPYKDFAQSAAGYDVYLNFNRVELVDEFTRIYGYGPLNQQAVYVIIAQMKGLPLPSRGLSPSSYVTNPWGRDGRTLLFSKASHSSRTLDKSLVEEIKRRHPDIVVDPEYPNLVKLSEAIGQARRVIGMDSGAVHIAEAFGTPWQVMHTTMEYQSRHKFYLHGSRLTSQQAGIHCSPCLQHGGCGNIICTDKFDVTKLFADPSSVQHHGADTV